MLRPSCRRRSTRAETGARRRSSTLLYILCFSARLCALHLSQSDQLRRLTMVSLSWAAHEQGQLQSAHLLIFIFSSLFFLFPAHASSPAIRAAAGVPLFPPINRRFSSVELELAMHFFNVNARRRASIVEKKKRMESIFMFLIRLSTRS